jgi:hypothetical protein
MKITDVIKPFTGEGDVTTWIKKLKMVARTQKNAEGLEMLIPYFLEGTAYTVYDQMEDSKKTDADAIEKVLLEAFSLNHFQAYDLFRQRNWQQGEPVDVYLSELRKLAKLANIDSEEVLRCAFVVGLPVDVSSQLRASSQILKSGLSTIVQQARVLMEGRLEGGSALVAAAGRQPTKAATQSSPIRCFRCGGSHLAKACPNVKCWSCGKEGHVSRNCRPGKDQGESRAPTTSPNRA